MTKKFIITIMVTMMTLTAAFAQTMTVNSKGFMWTETFVTNNTEAKALICETLGISGVEFEQFKGKYKLDMKDSHVWDGYNSISRRRNTPNASFVKQVAKDTYVVFAYSNGKLTYGNCFVRADNK